MTNSPFATSQPLTISSGPTSRSCTGHQRFCLIGVWHSRCSVRNETSEARAFGDVAGASPTGMVTRPKLSEPFQIVRMGPPSNSRGTGPFRRNRVLSCAARGHYAEILSETTATAPTEAGVQAGGGRTIGRLWRNAVTARRTNPAYLVEEPDGWREVALGRGRSRRGRARHGLLALGVRKGDAFAILAQTTLEWALFDFALGLIGAIGAAIYANSSPKDASSCSSIRRRSACWSRTRSSGRRSRRGPPPRHHVRRARRASRARPRVRSRAAECARRGRGGDRARTTSSRSSTRRARPARRRPA